MERNPFVIAGKIEPRDFCDRVDETGQLTTYLTNRNNVVLISPRRMGKTGLVEHVFEQPSLRVSYLTVFVDILSTTSLGEFTYLLGKKVYERLLSTSRKIALSLIGFLKSINGKFTYDAVTGLPSFSISIGDIEKPEFTLEEIFRFFASCPRPVIVAIDEFQQIARYPEKNVEALLRTYIQHTPNCNFIFAGSRRHLLQEMFVHSARPFYNSASLMFLGPIPREVYADFVRHRFAESGKAVGDGVVERVYDLFGGLTYCMQRVFNQAFLSTAEGAVCDEPTVERSIDHIIALNAPFYRETMSLIPVRQKEVLIAIARNEKVEGPMSARFIKSNGLSSASSVQAALKKLLEADIVTRSEKSYYVNDLFFRLWLRREY